MNYEYDQSNEKKINYFSEFDETDNSYSNKSFGCANEIDKNNVNFIMTAGSTSEVSTYFNTFPHDFNIFREIKLDATHIPNDQVRNITTQFLNVFQRVLILHRNKIENKGYLPPLKIQYLEDASVLMEWIFKDFRTGFSIEPIGNESSWYLVSNRNLDEESYGGQLDTSKAEQLLSSILSFVLANT